jgi:hypothetical protein
MYVKDRTYLESRPLPQVRQLLKGQKTSPKKLRANVKVLATAYDATVELLNRTLQDLAHQRDASRPESGDTSWHNVYQAGYNAGLQHSVQTLELVMLQTRAILEFQ